ncbi:amino acid ABC transporter substrate-binding protein [Oricola thermophila]|uniref:Amino acid ABC transporter substrate-binding protein n=1 Tax=Oricola thermophila TaxID=2742145 RepID=A0A6N1VEN6_9HYPH|nr:amino acid ABC transporter substrate-binding protein [Oricola thermophila]QKV17599.1 amino acid ABC transporter substrate-binding protein [Oricola thermophila]
MERRTLFKTIAATLLASTLAAGPVLADGVIRIGASAPKTGPLAGGAAVTYWPAIKLWVHDVNERGGIDVGGEKMKVELVEYDDRTSNEEAIKNIQRLATVDKVDFIVPPYGTGINLATAPLIAKYGYPHIAVTAVADGIEEFAKRWPNSFWTLGTSTAMATSLVDVLVEMRNAGQINEKVALVNVADSFGIELVNAGKPALEAAGFDIVYETSYPLQQQDFAPIISGAKNAAPDTFVAFSYPGDTFGLTKQAAIADLPVKAFYVGVATAFPAFPAANGDAANGIMGVGGVNADSELYQDFASRQKEVTGEAPDYWASPVQYASLQVLEQAITDAGTLDKAAVIDAIKNGTFDTIMGEWTFEDNIITKYWTVGQWQDGVFRGIASTGVGGEAEPILKSGWN